jgi:hypothetical protein
VAVDWQAGDGQTLSLAANLKSTSQSGFPVSSVAPFWLEGATTPDGLGPWAVRWSLTKATSS